MRERPSYFFYWLPPPCLNSWVPPFLHSASSLWLIDLLPHSCLTEESPGARKKEVRRWAKESSSDMAGPHNTQWILSQPSDWPLHGPVTWRIKKEMSMGKIQFMLSTQTWDFSHVLIILRFPVKIRWLFEKIQCYSGTKTVHVILPHAVTDDVAEQLCIWSSPLFHSSLHHIIHTWFCGIRGSFSSMWLFFASLQQTVVTKTTKEFFFWSADLQLVGDFAKTAFCTRINSHISTLPNLVRRKMFKNTLKDRKTP